MVPLAPQTRPLYSQSMSKIEIKSTFSPEKNSFSTSKGGEFKLYDQAGPYDYLLGALTGCLYKTFEEIAHKMRVDYGKVEMSIWCTKRETSPTTMDYCDITITAYKATDQARFVSAMEKATRYCSVFQTLSQVSKMNWSVVFA